MNHNNLEEFYDAENSRRSNWPPAQLRPQATSTNAYDDALRLLGNKFAGGRLLEIGCGTGKFSVSIAAYFDSIISTDISSVATDIAQDMQRQHFPKLGNKMKFVTANADEHFPFDDDEFDTVIMISVLEHVIDVFHVMEEIHRVLKRGGTLVMSVPNAAYIRHIRDLAFGRVPMTGTDTRSMDVCKQTGWDGQHLHNFTRSSMADLLQGTGFTPTKWSGDGKYAKFRRILPSLVGSVNVRATSV